MSIRSLTTRLKDEAVEARRREDGPTLLHAGANVEGMAPSEPGWTTASDGGNAMSHRSRATLGVTIPSDRDRDGAATPRPLVPGIRPKELGGRWNPPGGIAARFSLPANNNLGKPADPVDADVSRKPDPAVGSDASAEGRRVESPLQGDTTPITIELESHQESAD